MRLLLLVPSYYPDIYGGAERQASILAEALGRLGVHVTLLAPTLRPNAQGATPAAFGEVRRIGLKDFPARGGRYLASTLAWTWKTARLIWRERAAFDVVYVFHGRLHVAGPLLGARAAGLPIFVKPGAGGESADHRRLRRKRYLYGHVIAWLLLRWTTGFVAVSRQVEVDLQDAGVSPDRIHRQPNGVELVDADRLDAAQARRNGRRFISTCRLVHDKNVDVLIEAVAAQPQAELTLVGDGPEEPALRALALRLGAVDRVRFLGALNDVTSELIDHDAFLTASVHEGQSNSLLEALAAGVIPVAAKASGVAELVEDPRTGVITVAPTAEAFSVAIGRVLAFSPEQRAAVSRAAYAEAMTRFGIDGVARRLLTLFQSAAAAGRP